MLKHNHSCGERESERSAGAKSQNAMHFRLGGKSFFSCTGQSAVKWFAQQKPRRVSHKTRQFPCKGNMVKNLTDENTTADTNTNCCAAIFYRCSPVTELNFINFCSCFQSASAFRLPLQTRVSAIFRRCFIALLSGSEGYCVPLIRKWGPKSSQVWDRLNWRSRGRI